MRQHGRNSPIKPERNRRFRSIVAIIILTVIVLIVVAAILGITLGTKR